MSTPESAAETSIFDTTETPAAATTPPAGKAPWWKRLLGQG